MFAPLRGMSPGQRHAVLACYLGWTLDAFDYFILVFLLGDIAASFSTDVETVTWAIMLTLAMRPVGALLFGRLADRFGRRPVLMLNVLAYSLLEFASGFAPDLAVLMILRALYGVAMGGEWGVGAALILESAPAAGRGLISGILQAGYPSGYLLASLAFWGVYPYAGWRGLFMIGVLPALLVFYIRRRVDESPVFVRDAATPRAGLWSAVKKNFILFAWAAGMMTCFNFLSHGTQDLYPTFLMKQRGLDHAGASVIPLIYNIGAMLGGVFFGALSDKIGRRKAIVIAALLALPAIPLWVAARGKAGLAAGAFLMQFFVQGAWGVVPAHLNEIAPDGLRGTFPGLVYQLGNLLASGNAPLQAAIAAARGGDYGFALAAVAVVFALLLAAFVWFGREARARRF